MENEEILKRARDLARRSEQRGVPTNTGFLTPAERYALEHDPALRSAAMVFEGGYPEAERTMAFFLPDWMEEDGLDLDAHICALHLTAAFGSPGHRDYMGAILGMGVGREWVGDILVDGSEAIALCQPSVLRHLLSIDKVGRCGVKTEQIPLDAIPRREKKAEERRFTVMSPRLDAVAAGLFHLSRTETARQIALGTLSLNYAECLKPDAPVREGDVLSLRGTGKGRVVEIGGSSRKGRMFVTAELYR
ncbi:MAG: RNA-binding protein [Oscillospiraceae bacterium]|nr:RNA-binding protein [Oscillospiraceae bacterium]